MWSWCVALINSQRSAFIAHFQMIFKSIKRITIPKSNVPTVKKTIFRSVKFGTPAENWAKAAQAALVDPDARLGPAKPAPSREVKPSQTWLKVCNKGSRSTNRVSVLSRFNFNLLVCTSNGLLLFNPLFIPQPPQPFRVFPVPDGIERQGNVPSAYWSPAYY